MWKSFETECDKKNRTQIPNTHIYYIIHFRIVSNSFQCRVQKQLKKNYVRCETHRSNFDFQTDTVTKRYRLYRKKRLTNAWTVVACVIICSFFSPISLVKKQEKKKKQLQARHECNRLDRKEQHIKNICLARLQQEHALSIKQKWGSNWIDLSKIAPFWLFFRKNSFDRFAIKSGFKLYGNRSNVYRWIVCSEMQHSRSLCFSNFGLLWLSQMGMANPYEIM